MSQELIAAARLLADTLAEENVALTALDLPRAGSMLADKQRAVTGFLTACGAERTATLNATIAPLAQRLQSLSEENRTLLERAIAVQGRVIGIVARAAAPRVAASGYSAQGTLGHHARPTAFALCARA
ncbi:MAG TPA: hypothetical protein VNW90_08040 [Acetobacteraceae bacterium]|jgi:hypothetical protein|nr:hypothetical protein [Acetobacteraceae bacterium]